MFTKSSINIIAGILVCCSLVVISTGCKQSYTPRPLGYYRIDFPEKVYQTYNTTCPFEFEYPTYAVIIKDDKVKEELCWFNILFPDYNGVIHMSYKPVSGNLDEFTEDARKLTFKHTIKAEAIDETVYSDSLHEVYGKLFKVKGNAASSVQFYVTDSLHHFLRGSLYFNVEPNKDSLAPVIEFFTDDVIHFMESVRWK